MLKIKRKSPLKNQKGMAALEMIPIIVVVVLFMNFALGFFGVIHTGILNSIAARNYAFETFRHRSNLVYFRNGIGDDKETQYSDLGMRIHGIISENASGAKNMVASSRRIDFFDFSPRAAEASGAGTEHNTTSWEVETNKRFEKTGVNPVWVKTQYGICLNATCGGS